jgi:hypothetical protein
LSLGTFHGYRDSVRWRVTPDGVEIEDSGTERPTGKAGIATRTWELFAYEITAAAADYDVPCAHVVAMICTESAGGDPEALHVIEGYVSDEETPDRVCVGLMQTLLSTARDAVGKDVDRKWLLDAGNSIQAGAAHIQRQAEHTRLDPPLVAAAWAAGRVRYDPNQANRWRLQQGLMRQCFMAGGYCDRFVRSFNEGTEVLARAETRPAVGIEKLLDGKPYRAE